MIFFPPECSANLKYLLAEHQGPVVIAQGWEPPVNTTKTASDRAGL